MSTHQPAQSEPEVVVYRYDPPGTQRVAVYVDKGGVATAKSMYPDWVAIELRDTARADRRANPNLSMSAWKTKRLKELLTTESRFNIGASTATAEELYDMLLQPNGLPFPTAETVGPRRDPPALPLEVFNEQPIDANKAMDVTRVLCGGESRPWRELKAEGN